MLKDITLGQFFPGDSLLHRLDPRTKIVLLFFFLAAIFVFDSPLAYAALTAFTAALIAVSRVPLLLMLKALKPLSWIIAFTFVIHLVSTPGDAFSVCGSSISLGRERRRASSSRSGWRF